MKESIHKYFKLGTLQWMSFPNSAPLDALTAIARDDFCLLYTSCAAKKLEAMQEELRQDVDFVLTYEELMGIFEAKEIDFSSLPASEPLAQATSAGRGFAQAGGVAAAVEEIIRREHPDFEVKTQRADGLRECRKLLMLAKAGKFDGYLLEGMACPGGLSLIHI